ncbi:hypothetical protein [Mycoplasma sp. SG1]|uniref:hypothetical protein n=1 Tax=Mycoplasma sp. SG1 TaxID=2810348 RepID=UPI0020243FC0|nr:hypothetical protein [Mycoplasma sp. SG1]URM53141.1 hypothetical protein JRW51_02220 [Mycoplasma sp. SG1]
MKNKNKSKIIYWKLLVSITLFTFATISSFSIISQIIGGDNSENNVTLNSNLAENRVNNYGNFQQNFGDILKIDPILNGKLLGNTNFNKILADQIPYSIPKKYKYWMMFDFTGFFNRNNTKVFCSNAYYLNKEDGKNKSLIIVKDINRGYVIPLEADYTGNNIKRVAFTKIRVSKPIANKFGEWINNNDTLKDVFETIKNKIGYVNGFEFNELTKNYIRHFTVLNNGLISLPNNNYTITSSEITGEFQWKNNGVKGNNVNVLTFQNNKLTNDILKHFSGSSEYQMGVEDILSIVFIIITAITIVIPFFGPVISTAAGTAEAGLAGGEAAAEGAGLLGAAAETGAGLSEATTTIASAGGNILNAFRNIGSYIYSGIEYLSPSKPLANIIFGAAEDWTWKTVAEAGLNIGLSIFVGDILPTYSIISKFSTINNYDMYQTSITTGYLFNIGLMTFFSARLLWQIKNLVLTSKLLLNSGEILFIKFWDSVRFGAKTNFFNPTYIGSFFIRSIAKMIPSSIFFLPTVINFFKHLELMKESNLGYISSNFTTAYYFLEVLINAGSSGIELVSNFIIEHPTIFTRLSSYMDATAGNRNTHQGSSEHFLPPNDPLDQPSTSTGIRIPSGGSEDPTLHTIRLLQKQKNLFGTPDSTTSNYTDALSGEISLKKRSIDDLSDYQSLDFNENKFSFTSDNVKPTTNQDHIYSVIDKTSKTLKSSTDNEINASGFFYTQTDEYPPEVPPKTFGLFRNNLSNEGDSISEKDKSEEASLLWDGKEWDDYKLVSSDISIDDSKSEGSLYSTPEEFINGIEEKINDLEQDVKLRSITIESLKKFEDHYSLLKGDEEDKYWNDQKISSLVEDYNKEKWPQILEKLTYDSDEKIDYNFPTLRQDEEDIDPISFQHDLAVIKYNLSSSQEDINNIEEPEKSITEEFGSLNDHLHDSSFEKSENNQLNDSFILDKSLDDEESINQNLSIDRIIETEEQRLQAQEPVLDIPQIDTEAQQIDQIYKNPEILFNFTDDECIKLSTDKDISLIFDNGVGAFHAELSKNSFDPGRVYIDQTKILDLSKRITNKFLKEYKFLNNRFLNFEKIITKIDDFYHKVAKISILYVSNKNKVLGIETINISDFLNNFLKINDENTILERGNEELINVFKESQLINKLPKNVNVYFFENEYFKELFSRNKWNNEYNFLNFIFRKWNLNTILNLITKNKLTFDDITDGKFNPIASIRLNINIDAIEVKPDRGHNIFWFNTYQDTKLKLVSYQVLEISDPEDNTLQLFKIPETENDFVFVEHSLLAKNLHLFNTMKNLASDMKPSALQKYIDKYFLTNKWDANLWEKYQHYKWSLNLKPGILIHDECIAAEVEYIKKRQAAINALTTINEFFVPPQKPIIQDLKTQELTDQPTNNIISESNEIDQVSKLNEQTIVEDKAEARNITSPQEERAEDKTEDPNTKDSKNISVDGELRENLNIVNEYVNPSIESIIKDSSIHEPTNNKIQEQEFNNFFRGLMNRMNQISDLNEERENLISQKNAELINQIYKNPEILFNFKDDELIQLPSNKDIHFISDNGFKEAYTELRSATSLDQIRLQNIINKANETIKPSDEYKFLNNNLLHFDEIITKIDDFYRKVAKISILYVSNKNKVLGIETINISDFLNNFLKINSENNILERGNEELSNVFKESKLINKLPKNVNAYFLENKYFKDLFSRNEWNNEYNFLNFILKKWNLNTTLNLMNANKFTFDDLSNDKLNPINAIKLTLSVDRIKPDNVSWFNRSGSSKLKLVNYEVLEMNDSTNNPVKLFKIPETGNDFVFVEHSLLAKNLHLFNTMKNLASDMKPSALQKYIDKYFLTKKWDASLWEKCKNYKWSLSIQPGYWDQENDQLNDLDFDLSKNGLSSDNEDLLSSKNITERGKSLLQDDEEWHDAKSNTSKISISTQSEESEYLLTNEYITNAEQKINDLKQGLEKTDQKGQLTIESLKNLEAKESTSVTPSPIGSEVIKFDQIYKNVEILFDFKNNELIQLPTEKYIYWISVNGVRELYNKIINNFDSQEKLLDPAGVDSVVEPFEPYKFLDNNHLRFDEIITKIDDFYHKVAKISILYVSNKNKVLGIETINISDFLNNFLKINSENNILERGNEELSNVFKESKLINKLPKNVNAYFLENKYFKDLFSRNEWNNEYNFLNFILKKWNLNTTLNLMNANKFTFDDLSNDKLNPINAIKLTLSVDRIKPDNVSWFNRSGSSKLKLVNYEVLEMNDSTNNPVKLFKIPETGNDFVFVEHSILKNNLSLFKTMKKYIYVADKLSLQKFINENFLTKRWDANLWEKYSGYKWSKNLKHESLKNDENITTKIESSVNQVASNEEATKDIEKAKNDDFYANYSEPERLQFWENLKIPEDSIYDYKITNNPETIESMYDYDPLTENLLNVDLIVDQISKTKEIYDDNIDLESVPINNTILDKTDSIANDEPEKKLIKPGEIINRSELIIDSAIETDKDSVVYFSNFIKMNKDAFINAFIPYNNGHKTIWYFDEELFLNIISTFSTINLEIFERIVNNDEIISDKDFNQILKIIDIKNPSIIEAFKNYFNNINNHKLFNNHVKKTILLTDDVDLKDYKTITSIILNDISEIKNNPGSSNTIYPSNFFNDILFNCKVQHFFRTNQDLINFGLKNKLIKILDNNVVFITDNNFQFMNHVYKLFGLKPLRYLNLYFKKLNIMLSQNSWSIDRIIEEYFPPLMKIKLYDSDFDEVNIEGNESDSFYHSINISNKYINVPTNDLLDGSFELKTTDQLMELENFSKRTFTKVDIEIKFNDALKHAIVDNPNLNFLHWYVVNEAYNSLTQNDIAFINTDEKFFRFDVIDLESNKASQYWMTKSEFTSWFNSIDPINESDLIDPNLLQEKLVASIKTIWEEQNKDISIFDHEKYFLNFAPKDIPNSYWICLNKHLINNLSIMKSFTLSKIMDYARKLAKVFNPTATKNLSPSDIYSFKTVNNAEIKDLYFKLFDKWLEPSYKMSTVDAYYINDAVDRTDNLLAKVNVRMMIPKSFNTNKIANKLWFFAKIRELNFFAIKTKNQKLIITDSSWADLKKHFSTEQLKLIKDFINFTNVKIFRNKETKWAVDSYNVMPKNIELIKNEYIKNVNNFYHYLISNIKKINFQELLINKSESFIFLIKNKIIPVNDSSYYYFDFNFSTEQWQNIYLNCPDKNKEYMVKWFEKMINVISEPINVFDHIEPAFWINTDTLEYNNIPKIELSNHIYLYRDFEKFFKLFPNANISNFISVSQDIHGRYYEYTEKIQSVNFNKNLVGWFDNNYEKRALTDINNNPLNNLIALQILSNNNSQQNIIDISANEAVVDLLVKLYKIENSSQLFYKFINENVQNYQFAENIISLTNEVFGVKDNHALSIILENIKEITTLCSLDEFITKFYPDFDIDNQTLVYGMHLESFHLKNNGLSPKEYIKINVLLKNFKQFIPFIESIKKVSIKQQSFNFQIFKKELLNYTRTLHFLFDKEQLKKLIPDLNRTSRSIEPEVSNNYENKYITEIISKKYTKSRAKYGVIPKINIKLKVPTGLETTLGDGNFPTRINDNTKIISLAQVEKDKTNILNVKKYIPVTRGMFKSIIKNILESNLKVLLNSISERHLDRNNGEASSSLSDDPFIFNTLQYKFDSIDDYTRAVLGFNRSVKMAILKLTLPEHEYVNAIESLPDFITIIHDNSLLDIRKYFTEFNIPIFNPENDFKMFLDGIFNSNLSSIMSFISTYEYFKNMNITSKNIKLKIKNSLFAENNILIDLKHIKEIDAQIRFNIFNGENANFNYWLPQKNELPFKLDQIVNLFVDPDNVFKYNFTTHDCNDKIYEKIFFNWISFKRNKMIPLEKFKELLDLNWIKLKNGRMSEAEYNQARKIIYLPNKLLYKISFALRPKSFLSLINWIVENNKEYILAIQKQLSLDKFHSEKVVTKWIEEQYNKIFKHNILLKSSENFLKWTNFTTQNLNEKWSIDNKSLEYIPLKYPHLYHALELHKSDNAMCVWINLNINNIEKSIRININDLINNVFDKNFDKYLEKASSTEQRLTHHEQIMLLNLKQKIISKTINHIIHQIYDWLIKNNVFKEYRLSYINLLFDSQLITYIKNFNFNVWSIITDSFIYLHDKQIKDIIGTNVEKLTIPTQSIDNNYSITSDTRNRMMNYSHQLFELNTGVWLVNFNNSISNDKLLEMFNGWILHAKRLLNLNTDIQYNLSMIKSDILQYLKPHFKYCISLEKFKEFNKMELAGIKPYKIIKNIRQTQLKNVIIEDIQVMDGLSNKRIEEFKIFLNQMGHSLISIPKESILRHTDIIQALVFDEVNKKVVSLINIDLSFNTLTNIREFIINNMHSEKIALSKNYKFIIYYNSNVVDSIYQNATSYEDAKMMIKGLNDFVYKKHNLLID